MHKGEEESITNLIAKGIQEDDIIMSQIYFPKVKPFLVQSHHHTRNKKNKKKSPDESFRRQQKNKNYENDLNKPPQE